MSELSLINKSSYRNIKSKFIIKIFFSYLYEKTKLKTVKNNKTLQEIVNIKLINYKFYCSSYIIYEKNGKGKEYDAYNDYLKFEGEYLHGKRNGKGKEYNTEGIVIFEGEYLNGIKNGEGKEYYWNGNVIFVGQYLNGKRNGRAKEYI